ncbi:iron ABC transporter permease [Caballeronia sp. GAWG1-1]|uniref:ABC transporter permease n=1 Tax=Caballeronia sp. GAWG1-1 TaxID=2921742 RepID=UPI002028CD5C|nr:iron ABC transporter permease [Caballeronia sp. GAWG1-1]
MNPHHVQPLAADRAPAARAGISTRRLNQIGMFALLIAALAVLIVLPLGALILRGFVRIDNGHASASLAAFGKVFGDMSYWIAMGNTLVIALGSMLLATALGVMLAWCLVRTNVPWRGFLERAAAMPIFIPPFIGAFAWILFGAPRIGIFNVAAKWMSIGQPFNVYSYLGIVWVMGIYIAPYVMMIVAGALRNMDPSLEEAGQVAGLNRFRTMRVITLPVVGPSILSGAVLAFVISLGLFGTPVLLGMAKEIYLVTTRIYLELQQFPPDAGIVAVLAIYLMVLSVAANLVQQWMLRGRSFVTVTGKGFRPRLMKLGASRHAIAAAIWCYLALTVFAPIAIIAAAAFSTYAWSGHFTWNNLRFLWTTVDVRTTFVNSLLITIIAASATTVLGVAVSWFTTRSKMRGRQWIEAIVLLPMSVPSLAFALGVFFFWVAMPKWVGVYGTVWIIIIALVGRYISYSVRAISSSLVQIHPELEESARISGYGWTRALSRITLPLIMPSVISSWVMIYSIFVSELSIVLPLYTAETRTLSILSFDTWSIGQFSQVAALSLLQLMMGVGVMAAVAVITRRRESSIV